MTSKVVYSSLSWLLLTGQICRGQKVDSYFRRRLKGAQENTFVCITEEQCKEKFLSMSTGGTFLVGEYPIKGCFSRSSIVYFGTGSVLEEELAKTDLPGIQVRIWCDNSETEVDTNPELPSAHSQALTARFSPTKQPATQAFEPTVPSTAPIEIVDDGLGMDIIFSTDVTTSPTFTQLSTHVQEIDVNSLAEIPAVCTQNQCRENFLSLSSTGGRFIVGDFPTKGCFSESSNVYFGIGSATEEEIIKDTLPGIQKRIWCDGESKERTMKTSYNPTIQPPGKNLTEDIITTRTNAPTFQPHELRSEQPKPTSSKPTPMPTRVRRPLNQPTSKATANLTSILMPSKEKHTEMPTSFKPATTSPTIGHFDSRIPKNDLPTSPPLPTSFPTTTSPSNRPSNTSSPHTKQPTFNPVTSKPSSIPASNHLDNELFSTTAIPSYRPNNTTSHHPRQPTFNPVTREPSNFPTSSHINIEIPKNDLPTNRPLPTSLPLTTSPSNRPSSIDSPHKRQPAFNPVTSKPSIAPTSSHLDNEMPKSKPPTKSPPLPTLFPMTSSPSNSVNSTSFHRTKQPKLNPGTSNNRIQPSKKTTAILPSFHPTEQMSIATTKQVEGNSTVSRTVRLSPLSISLKTDSQTESIDVTELRFLLLYHLLSELKNKFPTIDGSSSDVLVSAALLDKLRLPQQEDKDSDSSVVPTREFGFAISSVFTFSGDSGMSVKVLDEVIRNSFAGESGDEFVRSLQNAEDDGLQSTRSVSVISGEAESELVEVVKSPLKSNIEEEPDERTNSWIFLSIVFSVGMVLVAMHITKTHIINSKDDELSEVNRSKEASEEQEINSGYSQLESAWDTMSVLSIEVKQVATGIMSVLSNGSWPSCPLFESVRDDGENRSDQALCTYKYTAGENSFESPQCRRLTVFLVLRTAFLSLLRLTNPREFCDESSDASWED